MQLKGIIFDMDGVLIDTEPVHMRAFDALLKPYRIHLTKSFFKQLIGISSKENFERLVTLFGLDVSPMELLEKKNQRYRQLLGDWLEKDGPKCANEGICDLVKALDEAGYDLAIASSSPFVEIEMILKGLQLEEFFTTRTHGLEVSQTKPNPEIFEMTVQRMQLHADQCIVIEDSFPGVTAAKRANLKCIAVPNEYTMGFDYSIADCVVDHTRDLTISLCQSI